MPLPLHFTIFLPWNIYIENYLHEMCLDDKVMETNIIIISLEQVKGREKANV